jgi:hypothetical protein
MMPVCSKLPDFLSQNLDILDGDIRKGDMEQKYLSKSYSDKKPWALPSIVSDLVLIYLHNQTDKLPTKLHPESVMVTK